MKRNALIGLSLLSVLLAGCQLNPAISPKVAKQDDSLKTANGPLTQKMDAPLARKDEPDKAIISRANPAGPVGINSANGTPVKINGGANKNIDPTGLVGKTITPPLLPKNSDITLMAYGNNYFECGGSVIGNEQDSLSITLLRKGIKTKCNGRNLTVAITKSSNNNKTHEFLDVILIDLPKGYDLSTSDCQGATLAVSKSEDKEFITHHLKAWNVINGKFSPVTNLKSVKCTNPGYGL